MEKKHAYLILAHNQFELLNELLVVLDDERNDIYLHIDKKVVEIPEKTLKNTMKKAKIYISKKRYNITWGGTKMVQCTLSLLEKAGTKYCYYHLISGVDFPIKNQDYIHNFFQDNYGKQFIGFDWNAIKSGSHINRIKYYHLLINIIGKRDKSNIIYKLLYKIEDLSLLLQRKLKINRISYNVYKGSQWFSISNDCVVAILSHKKEILKRYRFGLVTDEIWLQTFIMEYFPDCVAESNMRFIKWIQGNNSPEILTSSDYDALRQSNMLFARKFDWDKSDDLIKKLKSDVV